MKIGPKIVTLEVQNEDNLFLAPFGIVVLLFSQIQQAHGPDFT